MKSQDYNYPKESYDLNDGSGGIAQPKPGDSLHPSQPPADLSQKVGQINTLSADFSNGSDYVSALALDHKGNVYLAGKYTEGRSWGGGILSLKPSDYGYTINPDFGRSGRVMFRSDLYRDAQFKSIHIQEDGKILVAGRVAEVGSQGWETAVWRYMPDGRSLDPEFGDLSYTNNQRFGMAVSAGFGESAGWNASMLQPDGKLVVVGETNNIVDVIRQPNSKEWDVMIARYRSNGDLDEGFGMKTGSHGYQPGFSVVDVDGPETGLADKAHAVALQEDGNIVVVGESNGRVLVLRFWGKSGTLDMRFANNGIYAHRCHNDYHAKATSVVVQPDQKILVGGTCNNDLFFLRLLSDGTPDPSFGVTPVPGYFGYVFVNLGGLDQLNDLKLQSDGKIFASTTVFVAGDGKTGKPHQFKRALVRLYSYGVIDSVLLENEKTTQGGPLMLREHKNVLEAFSSGGLYDSAQWDFYFEHLILKK